MSKEEKHYHLCKYQLSISSCKVKIFECENLEINGSCDLPHSIGTTCSNYECLLTNKIDSYKQQLEECKFDLVKSKQLNTHFRTLLLMPLTVEREYKDSEINTVVRSVQSDLEKQNRTQSGIFSIISQQKQTWDSLDIKTVLYFLEYHQKFAEHFAQYCSEKIGKINIKNDLQDQVKDRKKQETKEAIASNNISNKTPVSKYEKAVLGFMKTTGMPREHAEKVVQSMGLHP